MRHFRRAAWVALLSCSAAWAGPDTYTYDALGRLVRVERAGALATVRSEYTYDAAGNRTRVVVTDQAPPPPPPTFAISDASAAEGDPVVFTVIRAGDLSGSNSVSYATAANTAAVVSDFTPQSGTLTFGPGEATKTISVVTIDDAAMEMDETFFVNLSSPTGGATLADSLGVGTIYDDDDGGGGGCLAVGSAIQEVGSDPSMQQQPQMLPPPGC